MTSIRRDSGRLKLARLRARIVRLFPDREIYMRSNGKVRFLRIPTGFQVKLAAAAGGALFAWLVVSAGILASQYQVREVKAAIGAQARAVERTASKVEAFRASIGGKADQLEARQQFLDVLAGEYFGTPADAAQSPIEPVPAETSAPQKLLPVRDAAEVSARRLAEIERTQFAFAEKIAALAEARADRAETTVRRLGLNPRRLTRSAAAVGGPFVPLGARVGPDDLRFARLRAALARLDRLERALLAVPSLRPAAIGRLSSGFGPRFDPFTRWPAMHMGQDFSGRRGQPIRAAAPGRVVRAGWWSGYGKAVVIDHGRGLATRYGHLSAFDVRPGDRVARGELIGRMGSTGRSTGNHLHFEVRIDGRAVNPRPFLEASSNVLKIQSHIKKRIVRPRHAG